MFKKWTKIPPEKKLQNCWEFKQCGEEKTCSAATATQHDGQFGGLNGGRYCAFIEDNECFDSKKTDPGEKLATCVQCEFYHEIISHAFSDYDALEKPKKATKPSSKNRGHISFKQVDNTITYYFSGSHSYDSMKEFRKIYREKGRADYYEINLNNIDQLSSVIVGGLLYFREEVGGSNSHITLRHSNANAEVKKIIDFSGLNMIFHIV
jgi:anti-anti-sigma regulatory factor